MKPGSIVETVYSFDQERMTWNLPYPKKGDILTVSSVAIHPNSEEHKISFLLLKFEELPDLPGLCHMRFDGNPNFVELILPDDIKEILYEPLHKKELLTI